MKQTKRLISVLLALLMALSAFSVGAFAGGDDTVVKEITVSGSVVPKAGRSPQTASRFRQAWTLTVFNGQLRIRKATMCFSQADHLSLARNIRFW